MHRAKMIYSPSGSTSVVGPRPDPKHRLRLLALLAGVVLIGGFTDWWTLKRLAWHTPFSRDIAAVVRGALSVNGDVRVQRNLSRYFAGELLREQRLTYRPGGRAGHEWKLTWVHFQELDLAVPGHATATASADLRSPRGVISGADYTFYLVITASGWRIDGEDLQFEPGYRP
ncbi:MAG: hypothetical protein DLM70_01870 [Chloroflexi bacterium]|nr:MAG: hypothetical protein DLM70_01870 [Chloroflexota bacterium]